ncbi:glycosyltransferase family 4 protein [Tenacibaculum ovolyticum]|uniref:glycosyltransferase family 4 protein n=1 Tax=Tenacibaculum ovolyticum TaxID=104270 RepID=UPI0007ECD8B7|nr:glycosyltransferase family 4 protein [Tenacibaculum ovolyticum]
MQDKIFLVSPLTPTGGISSWSKNMLNYISIKNIDNIVHIDSSNKFKTHRYAVNILARLFLAPLDAIYLFFKLLIELLKEKPNVLHITSSGSFSLFKDFLVLILTKFFKVRCVFHYRFGRIPELNKKKNWEWRLLFFLVKKADKVIVIDSPTFNVFFKLKMSDKVFLIPNPCALDISKLAFKDVIEKEINSFIFVGHVINAKGVFELVEAFTKNEHDLKLTMMGLSNGVIEKDLYKISSEKKGNWLKIIGNQKKDIVINYMKNSTALILPSYTEGFPNVILEAMAAGCPILASNVAEIPYMLNVKSKENAAGVCFKPKSVESLTIVLNDFINKPEKHFFYAENGKKNVREKYTMDIVFPMYESVWNN